MKLLTTLLVLLTTTVSFSQIDFIELWDYYQAGDTVYLANGGHLREAGSRNAKSMGQMPVATRLVITGEQTSTPEVIYHLSGKYFPVKWESPTGLKHGYVWQCLLAKTMAKDKAQNTYVFGWKSYSPTDNVMTYALSRVDALGKIQEFPLKDTFSYHSSYDSKVLGAMGLTGVKNIFRVAMLGEACGVATIYNYYAWDGNQFHVLPQKMSVGDAGVYYYSEELKFPSEHKLADDVIMISSEESEYALVRFKGVGNELFQEGTVVHKYRFYKWTGKGFYELEKEED